jgi:hypothetical protein
MFSQVQWTNSVYVAVLMDALAVTVYIALNEVSKDLEVRAAARLRSTTHIDAHRCALLTERHSSVCCAHLQDPFVGAWTPPSCLHHTRAQSARADNMRCVFGFSLSLFCAKARLT